MKKYLPLIALLVTGCASVPTTDISMPTSRGPFKMSFPKDMSWTNVVFEASPDGTVKASIGSVTSYNDAAVIGVVAGANAAMLHDGLDFAKSALNTGKSAVVP